MFLKKAKFSRLFPFSWRDLLVSIGILLLASGLCILLQMADSHEGFASPIFVLAVLLISHLTTGYLFGFLASLAGVICVNLIFTYPYWAVNFTLAGYPVTFLSFLIVSIVTCALTNQVRQQQQLRSEAEKEKIRANLLRSVSHDIRTPLTSIIGSTSTVLDNPALPAKEQQKLLADVRDEAQFLIRVVENLLSITRMGNDPAARLIKSPEAPEEILSDAAEKFRRRFPAIRVTVNVPDEFLLVPMDPILILQVLSNLMENAVIHGKTTDHIHLALQKDDTYARFSVSDNGCGIPENLLPSLFDGTLRGNTSPSGDGKRNLGLGLSVCNAIIRTHGGSLTAKNLPVGAEFTFQLPLDD